MALSASCLAWTLRSLSFAWVRGAHRCCQLVLDGREVSLKPEYFAPTSSFKDRGTAVMINILAHQGVTHVADDSSGNAGASVAAYAARAGMQADIFVPAYASPAKQAQIAVYGANVRPIPGPRGNAKVAALEATEQGITLASHAYHPGFLLGQQSVAWELWEQMGRRGPIGTWYLWARACTSWGCGWDSGAYTRRDWSSAYPGSWRSNRRSCRPLCQAHQAGLDTVPAVEPGKPSVAEGLAIAAPVRGRRLLQAVRESGGTCVMVEEQAIHAAQRLLAYQGFYVEPTSATAVAALKQVKDLARPEALIVIPLTGSGLKGSPVLE